MIRTLLAVLALLPLTAWRADAQAMSRVRPPIRPDCSTMPTVGRTLGELCTASSDNTLRYWDGATWTPIGTAAGANRASPVTVLISYAAGFYTATEGTNNTILASDDYSASDVVQVAYDYVYDEGGGDIVFAAGSYNWTECVHVYPQNPGWVRFSGSGSSTKLMLDDATTGGGSYNFFCLDNGAVDIPGDYRWFWFQDFQMDSRNKIPTGKDYPSSSFIGEDANLGDTSGDATGAKLRYSLYNRSLDGLVVLNVQNLNVHSVPSDEYVDASSTIGGIVFRIRQTNSDLANQRSVKNVHVSNYRQVGGVTGVYLGITNDEGDTENSNGTFENISIVNSFHDVNVPITAPNITSIASTCWHIGNQATTSKDIFISETVCKNSGDNCVEVNQGESVFIQNNTCENAKLVGLTISNLGHPVSNTRKQNLVVDGWYQDCLFPAGFDTYYNGFCNVIRMEACPDTTCYPNGDLVLKNIYHHRTGPTNFYNHESIKIEGAIFRSILLENYTLDMELTVDATQTFTYTPLWISTVPEDLDGDETYNDTDVNITLDGIHINYSLTDNTSSESYYRSLYGAILAGQEGVYRVNNFNVNVDLDGTFGATQNLIGGILLGTQTRRPNFDIAGTRTCSDTDGDTSAEGVCSHDAGVACARNSDCYFDTSEIRNAVINDVRINVNHSNPSATAPSIYGVMLDLTDNVTIDEATVTNVSIRDNYIPDNVKKILAVYGPDYAHPNVLCPDQTQSSWTCFQGKATPDYINIGLAATSGLGTSAHPWTGWDTLVNTIDDVDLYFPCGYYSVSSAFVQEGSNVTIRGDGECTVLKSSAGTGSIANFTGDHIKVQDMKFDCNERGGRTAGVCVTADNDYQEYSRIHVYDSPSRLFEVTDGNHVNVHDSIFESDATGNAALVAMASGNTTTDTRFTNNEFISAAGTLYYYVFGVFGSNSNLIFSGNKVTGMSDPAISINAAGANHLLFTNNIITGGTGFRIQDGDNITISNNSYYGDEGGYFVQASGGKNISVIGNTVVGEPSHGTYGVVKNGATSQLDGLFVSGNTFSGTDGACVYLQSDATYTSNQIVASNNTCMMNGNYTCWTTDHETSALAADVAWGINKCFPGSAAPISLDTNASWTYTFDEGMQLKLGGVGLDGQLKLFNEAGTDYESCLILDRCGSYNCIKFDGDCNFSGASDQSCWIMDSSSGGQDKNCDGTAD
jgi:hypothetical protein